MPRSSSFRVAAALLVTLATCEAYLPTIHLASHRHQRREGLRQHVGEESEGDRQNDARTALPSWMGDDEMSRRDAFKSTIARGFMLSAGGMMGGGTYLQDAIAADDTFTPAKRPTMFFVDSTQPPTMIPFATAPKQLDMLKKLGKGSGTDKVAVKADTINLNNILNKLVFGTIDAVQTTFGLTETKEKRQGEGFASFVCFGMPPTVTSEDVELASGLVDGIMSKRKGQTAMALPFVPLSSQSDLDAFAATGDSATLQNALVSKGVSEPMLVTYMPLLINAKKRSIRLLAAAPEFEDVVTARQQGLQNVDPARRSSYVADTEGFIALSGDPKFRLYTDRSLLKDFQPQAPQDAPGNFFAERILVHETAATVAAAYSVSRPDSLVFLVAPIADVRYLQGMNGRIPRVYSYLRQQQGGKASTKVTEDAVTTILLNPTAETTLSKSRYMRLEIGTGSKTLKYQAKVSDYIWFSKPPKVNMVSRMMN